MSQLVKLINLHPGN